MSLNRLSVTFTGFKSMSSSRVEDSFVKGLHWGNVERVDEVDVMRDGELSHRRYFVHLTGASDKAKFMFKDNKKVKVTYDYRGHYWSMTACEYKSLSELEQEREKRRWTLKVECESDVSVDASDVKLEETSPQAAKEQ